MSAALGSDARRRLRESLHRHVHGTDDWAQPSLDVFRNLLLDDVGSDARPLANLLLEALDRGVGETLPRTPMPAALWSARCTALVMQWVGERFVQPDAARWAVEAWAFAFGAINAAQLTAFVDRPVEVDDAPAWVQTSTARQTSTGKAGNAPPARQPARRGAYGGTPPSAAAGATWRAASAASGHGTAAGGRPVAYARPVPARPRYVAPRSSGWWPDALDNVVAKASVAIMAGLAVFVAVQAMRGPDSLLLSQRAVPVSASDSTVVSVERSTDGTTGLDTAFFDGNDRRLATEPYDDRIGHGAGDVARNGPTNGAATSTSAPSAEPTSRIGMNGIGVGGTATRVPLVPGSGSAPSLAMTRLPAQGATPGAYQELADRSTARRLANDAAGGTTATGGADEVVPGAPGVPGITRNAMPLSAQQEAASRRVVPATRPTNRTTRTSTPPAAAARTPAENAPDTRRNATGLDELRLDSGRRIQGRVEVIRASSVIFRDAETGLRYEFAKNDITEIISEFGNSVRFRAEGGPRSGSALDRRGRSLAGRYTVHYDAARVVGVPACQELWRGPSGSDVAVVTHLAGADTLTIAFEGGDRFQSVLNTDGFFSSTFRIMPGQAELATALTTRLSGRFGGDGTLAVQITVIGYRRVQGTRGVACEITVDATGTLGAP